MPGQRLRRFNLNVYTDACKGGNHQNWQYFGYTIRNRQTGRCLDTGNYSPTNGNVYTDTCAGSASQNWAPPVSPNTLSKPPSSLKHSSRHPVSSPKLAECPNAHHNRSSVAQPVPIPPPFGAMGSFRSDSTFPVGGWPWLSLPGREIIVGKVPIRAGFVRGEVFREEHTLRTAQGRFLTRCPTRSRQLAQISRGLKSTDFGNRRALPKTLIANNLHRRPVHNAIPQGATGYGQRIAF